MSTQLAHLCSVILQQYFGGIVQKVGDCLFSAVQTRTLSVIMKSTGLNKIQVTNALAILIKFRLVLFEPSANEQYAEYSLIRDNILLILRYPR